MDKPVRGPPERWIDLETLLYPKQSERLLNALIQLSNQYKEGVVPGSDNLEM